MDDAVTDTALAPTADPALAPLIDPALAPLTDPALAPMIEAALAAREQAHAPYSQFRVGAAIRCERGIVHAGCNVENAAYPQGVCAEAGAISAMILSGSRRIEAVVIAGGGNGPCTPCGGCRQKIREFAGPEAGIRMVDPSGRVLLVRSLAELLPDSFGPSSLQTITPA